MDTTTTTAAHGNSIGSPMRPFAARRRFGWAVLIVFLGVASLPIVGLVRRQIVGAPPSAVAWRADFEAARAEARTSGRPLLVDFTAVWCPPCQAMDRDAWPDARVGALANGRFVPVKLDVDAAEGGRVGRHYGIVEIPTILVLDADGAVLDVGSFMTAGELARFLERERTTR